MDPKYIRNRFYVGSPTIFHRVTGEWGHRDIMGATQHAKELMSKRDDEEVFIVEIVRVVKRADRPIVIEDMENVVPSRRSRR